MSIEQLSTSVKFVCFYTNDGVGATGLAVTVDVRNPAGTEIVTAAAATEIGDGFYSYTLASGSTGTEGEYLAVFKCAGTVDQAHLPSLWVIGRGGVENLDAAVSSRTSGSLANLDAAVSTRATPDDVEVTVVAGSGDGSVEYADTVEDTNGDGIEGAEVVVRSTTNPGGAVRARVVTDSTGSWTVNLDPGTYYAWVQLSRFSANNPTEIEVEA